MCVSAGISVYEVEDGTVWPLCIKFAICPECGRVYRNHNLRARATDKWRHYGEDGIERDYEIVSGDWCWHYGTLSVHHAEDGIPVELPLMAETTGA